MKSEGTSVFGLLGSSLVHRLPPAPQASQHPSNPGSSPLHFVEANTERRKAKWLAQRYQGSGEVTEPEF